MVAKGIKRPGRRLTIMAGPRTKLLTTRQAAGRLGVSEGTVRAQIQKGRLRAEKPGRDLLIRPAEIDRYAREVQPARRGGRRSSRAGESKGN